VGIGRDPRLSGELLESAVALGLVNGQVDEVVLCGLATTPAMFLFSQVNSGDEVAAAGIMLTASHMPFQNNGLKFFTAEGGLGKQDISQVTARNLLLRLLLSLHWLMLRLLLYMQQVWPHQGTDPCDALYPQPPHANLTTPAAANLPHRSCSTPQRLAT
jgi:phosphoglucomutase